ncbi:unnamed protein product [Prorocentrum cordatum]|uniref:FIST C-domain domain-containing protein n=1 Tax=Prorocentrum cordatum TaxID=2364126 RepID=A0ABN9T163_9DINO|nr:unnamed protein product [Polarella glacialis]
MAAGGCPLMWRPSVIRIMETDSLGASAARRAARRRGRAALEAALRPLVAARGAPGSWVDRERASRPALQKIAAGDRVPGVMRLRRNAAWHARRVPPGGFTAASSAALSWAAMPRETESDEGTVQCESGDVDSELAGRRMAHPVLGEASVDEAAVEFAEPQVSQAPMPGAEVTDSMISGSESVDVDSEVAARCVAHPEPSRSSGAAVACSYPCDARRMKSAEGAVLDASYAAQGEARGGAVAEEFMDAQVSLAPCAGATLGDGVSEAVAVPKRKARCRELLEKAERDGTSPFSPEVTLLYFGVSEGLVTVGGSRAGAGNVAFGLVFVPSRWAVDLHDVVAEVQRELGWPRGAPLLGVLTSGGTLCVGAGMQDVGQPPAQAVLVDEAFLEEVSRESMRVQDTIDREPLRSIQVYGGKLRGSVLAGRALLGREATDVGSGLVFGESGSGLGLTRRAMALLDACYPEAGKAGLLSAFPEAGGSTGAVCLAGVGDGSPRYGRCAVLLLAGGLGTAINLCGVAPIGPELEVFDADVQRGIIRTVGDLPRGAAAVAARPDGRRPSVPAATALRRVVLEHGVSESQVWVGLPRGSTRDSAQLRVAPGAGDWALFPWGVVSAEGSLLLQGGSPRLEGVCSKGIDRVQLFVAKADEAALGRLADAYSLKQLFAAQDTEAAADRAPFATLCLLGGSGPSSSVRDERLYDGVVAGEVVLGCAGASIPFGDDQASDVAMRLHRQAAGMVMLYSSPPPAPLQPSAPCTGARA